MGCRPSPTKAFRRIDYKAEGVPLTADEPIDCNVWPYSDPTWPYHWTIDNYCLLHYNAAPPAPVHPGMTYRASVHPGMTYTAPVHPGITYTAPVNPGMTYRAPVHPGMTYTAPLHPGMTYTAPYKRNLAASRRNGAASRNNFAATATVQPLARGLEEFAGANVKEFNKNCGPGECNILRKLVVG